MASISAAGVGVGGIRILFGRPKLANRRRRLSCCPETPTDPGSPVSPEKPSLPETSSVWGAPSSSLSAGVAAVGFLETGYLAYLKLTGGEAFCPAGGAACSDVLNSEYAAVFGVPLSLLGMVAYGSVAFLSVQRSRKRFLQFSETDISLVLLATTTSMAAASAYFLYILSTKFDGVTCGFCLFSAVLSFTLFFLTVKDFGLENIQKVVGIQFVAASVVVLTLVYSHSLVAPQTSGSDNFALDYYETPVTKESTSFAISLAKHLRSVGAKMYGAFWCFHCHEQKEMFGHDAAQILDYIECFPAGAGKGKLMIPECAAAGVEGFPTWVVKGKVLSGEQELSALADASGFVSEDMNPS